jgi:hypothetical protein
MPGRRQPVHIPAGVCSHSQEGVTSSLPRDRDKGCATRRQRGRVFGFVECSQSKDVDAAGIANIMSRRREAQLRRDSAPGSFSLLETLCDLSQT